MSTLLKVIPPCILVGVGLIWLFGTARTAMGEQEKIRFLPIGDSYTIGAGVSADQSWPKILQDRSPKLILMANPAVSGFTIEDVRRHELPLAQSLRPDLISLLIGTNDWVRGKSEMEYRTGLAALIDDLQKALSPGGKLVILENPNFSVTPWASTRTFDHDIAQGLTRFNEILREEATKRKLPVVPLFSLSTQLNTQPGMLAPDGLHPSGKQYLRWVELIQPLIQETLAEPSNSAQAPRAKNDR